MRDSEKLNGFLENYKDEQTHKFYTLCSATEAEGYGVWPRLRETAEFCKKMGYKKIGIAFCAMVFEEMSPRRTFLPTKWMRFTMRSAM